MGFNKIALASDPFQTKLLRKFARKKISEEIEFIPFVNDTLKALESSMVDPEIDYKKAFKQDFKSIKERQSFWKRLRGTMGKNIDTTAY